MRAVDINVILRLVTGDDPLQEAVARALIEREKVFVPLTVVLECEWVLRSFYKYSRSDIASALTALSSHPGLVFDDVGGVRWALERYVGGADFDDVIHLLASAAGGATALVTFDDDMATEVGADTPIPVERPA